MAVWLYKQLNNIKTKDRQYVEVELRVGKLIHPAPITKETASYWTEGVLDPACTRKTKFSTDCDSNTFALARHKISEFKPAGQAPSIISTETRDTYYSYKGSGLPSGIRVTTGLDGATATPVSKTQHGDLFLSLPGSDLDYKLSISLETPVPENSIDPENLKQRFVRSKSRTSYKFADYEVCFTNVKGKNELEVELDQSKLLRLFQNLKEAAEQKTKDAAWKELEQFVGALPRAAGVMLEG